LIFGVIIMLLGATLFLDRTGIIDAFDYTPFWPIVIITIGLAKLSHRRKDGRREGGWWVGAGVVLLLNQMHLMRMRDAWPLFLVAFGVSIVWKELVHRPRMHERVE
jgi:LiaF transmembrane domain